MFDDWCFNIFFCRAGAEVTQGTWQIIFDYFEVRISLDHGYTDCLKLNLSISAGCFSDVFRSCLKIASNIFSWMFIRGVGQCWQTHPGRWIQQTPWVTTENINWDQGNFEPNIRPDPKKPVFEEVTRRSRGQRSNQATLWENRANNFIFNYIFYDLCNFHVYFGKTRGPRTSADSLQTTKNQGHSTRSLLLQICV